MLRKIRRHRVCRHIAWMLSLTLAVTPAGARSSMPPVGGSRATSRAARAAVPNPLSRALTEREMSRLSGSGLPATPLRSPYLCGTMPWQRSFRDVNLSTGNLFKSFTDIQVAPARGAGLVLQRTYNSNDGRVGPFGIGWTHAYDIRMQEAGIPDGGTKEICVRTDFFGGMHKYTRDADGLYTPPPYLYDELSSEYDVALATGPSVVDEDTEVGMDGTVKHFFANGDERACDSITDRHGNVTTLSYETRQGLTKKVLVGVTDPSGRTLSFSWRNFGTGTAPIYRIETASAAGQTVLYEYETASGAYGLAEVRLDPNGLNRRTKFTYTSVGTAPNQATGLLATIEDPLQRTMAYTYGVPTSTFTGTVFVLTITEPSGSGSLVWTIATHIADNAPGVWASVCCSDGSFFPVGLNMVSDASLRVVSMAAGWEGWTLGRAYAWEYDSNNNVSHQVITTTLNGTQYKSGHTCTYGTVGNVLTDSVDGFVDANGNPTEVTRCEYYHASKYFQKKLVEDPLHRVTNFDYHDRSASAGLRGNVLWVQDAGYADPASPSYQKQFTYEYNAYGQKTKETNLNGVVTDYVYGDARGNLTTVAQDPTGLNRVTQTVYDDSGRVLTTTDPNGQTSTFVYNALGQPTSATFPTSIQNVPGEAVTYVYGGNGRLETVSVDGVTDTAISYSGNTDRPASVTDRFGNTVGYTYNALGERTAMALPGGGSWTYGYADQYTSQKLSLPKDDPNTIGHVLSRITDDAGRAADYTIDSGGFVHQAKTNQQFDGNGNPLAWQQADYTVDRTSAGWTHYRLLQLQNTYHVTGQPTRLLTQNDYTYNLLGLRTENAVNVQATPAVTRTEVYGYDSLNRLTYANYGDQHWQVYAFDAMGNRTSLQFDGLTRELSGYNPANMLLYRNGNTYTNDANGNQLTGGGRVNTWDSVNRLRTCVAGQTSSQFAYGPDGLRKQSTVNGAVTRYILDSSMVFRETNGQNVPQVTYLIGPRGPEYRRTAGENAQVRWYCYDGLGSVLAEVDTSGNITGARQADVYGAPRATQGSPTSKHAYVGGLGHPTEDDTGLIYMRARWMDPVTGTFVSEDPAQDGENWFAYCGSNPINSHDRTGLCMLGGAIAALTGAFNDLASGSADTAAGAAGRATLNRAIAYWSGYIAGFMLACETDTITGHATNVGFSVSGGNIQVHFHYGEPNWHGGPHADFQGALESFFTRTFGKGSTRVALTGEFMGGFTDGFLAGL